MSPIQNITTIHTAIRIPEFVVIVILSGLVASYEFRARVIRGTALSTTFGLVAEIVLKFCLWFQLCTSSLGIDWYAEGLL